MKIILSTNGHDYKSSALVDIEPSFSDGRLWLFVTVLRSRGSFANRFRHYAQVLEGDKVILHCKSRGFFKGMQLSLTEPSGRTTHAKEYRPLIEVTLNRVTEENSGEYTCNAKDARKGLRRGVESVNLEVINIERLQYTTSSSSVGTVKLTSGHSDFSLVTSTSPSLNLGVTRQSYNEFNNPLTPRPTPRSTTRLPSLSPQVIRFAIEDDVRMADDSISISLISVGITITGTLCCIISVYFACIRRNGALQVLENQDRHRQEIASNGSSSSYEVQEENRTISEGSSQTEFQERHTVAPMAASCLDRTNYFDSLSPTLYAMNPRSLDSRSLHVVVGPDGGSCQSGDTLLSVPSGALLFPIEIILMIFLDEGAMPSYEILQNMAVFSPVLSLEPHNLFFRVPVRVRFPFTAGEGWTVNLMRQDPESGWHSVLTIDTDTFEQMSLDSHCRFFAHSSELELSHFCKYSWCGRKKENALLSRKKLGCSLYARLDSAATSCQFILCLHDYCDEAYQETKKLLPRSKPRFKLKDCSVIDICLEGYLTILMQPGNLHVDGENPVIISLKDLWRRFGMQKRVDFSAKLRTQSENCNESLAVTVHLTSETGSCKQDIKLLAIFEHTPETKSEPSQEDQHSTLSSGHGSISSVCEASSSFEESNSSSYLNPRTASNASNASSGKSQTESAVPPEPTEVKERQIDHNSESYLSMESLQVPSRGHLLTFFK